MIHGGSVKVSEIAALFESKWEGEDRNIRGVAALDSAQPDQLSFVGNRKAAGQAMSSAAGCLLVTADFPAGRTVIRVADPRAAFARVVRRLYPPKPLAPGIHPTAVIDGSASIGNNPSIGPHVVIGARVSIGSDCQIHPNVTIYDDVTVGDRAVLHSGCVIGADGFGFVLTGDHYEKFPQIGRVEIGDDVEIGANSCIDRAALGATEIGSGAK